jgi:MIP family channel proteins
MIYALGHISAAHFNPAVSVGFAVARRFPWRYVAPYVAAQCLGAVSASALHAVLIPSPAAAAGFGATLTELPPIRALGVEAVLTFFLMLVIMSVATDKRVDGAAPGLAIGATVLLCGLFGGALTGCSMNPARSLGPALFSGTAGSLWLYILGPVAGAALAALAYETIRGESHHAQGAPNDLGVALETIGR